MSASHGCTDDKVVVGKFKEALKERIGADRYDLWFLNGVDFHVAVSRVHSGDSGDDASMVTFAPPNANGSSDLATEQKQIVVDVRNQFAADRMKANFLRELRAAAMQAGDSGYGICVQVKPTAVQQTFTDSDSSLDQMESSQSHPRHQDPPVKKERASRSRSKSQPSPRTSRKNKRGAKPLSSLLDFSEAKLNPAKAKEDEQKLARNQSRGSQSSGIQAHQTETKLKTSPQSNRSHQHGSIKSNLLGEPSGVESSKGDRAAQEIQSTSKGDVTGHDVPSVMTLANFIGGASNQLAITATQMACQLPGSATPLFFHGPTGTGKSHLIHAIAEQFRRRHRMRRVVHLSAEHFTNDFIKSVGTSGLASFRRRYRDVDALLIDDIQFVAAKKATLRELLYTIETLLAAGKPMVFTANQSPSDIDGLSLEVIGRMASGLVCPLAPLCYEVRLGLLDRMIKQRCLMEWPDTIRKEIGECLEGDGRMISGVVNLVGTLQRMYGRMPSMDEIQQFGGNMLRSHGIPVTLTSIERAVCRTFQLDDATLRSTTQTRSVSEPRMLAMYLSRQLTSSAYSEIAGHYGGRSHSTAISASKKVDGWLKEGKSIGRGPSSVTTQQAIHQIEQFLRTG